MLSHNRAAGRRLTFLILGVAAIGLLQPLGAASAMSRAAAPAHQQSAHPASSPSLLAHRPWPGHPGRYLVTHVVRSGETTTGLAVRYHAWTAELLAVNGLRSRSTLRIGQRVLIPVVAAAVRRHTPRASGTPSAAARSMHARGWRSYRMGRAQVRDVVTRTARRHGVRPELALAVAWQESGWHQPLVSSAGAIGVMQVLPGTGTWMEARAQRELNLRGTRDNVTAGVLLLKTLRTSTADTRRAVAAYYQGLGAVREHGLYRDTRQYVASVLAIRRNLRHGRPPG